MPRREGVLDTPKRVIDAYEEIYDGYRECPAEVLDRTFSETGGYDDFVLVKDISFNSHCEHHMMPFYGKAHVAYMPIDRVVGLSKLARLVDVYAHRLQTQEHMTSQIATAIEEILKPRGVAVMIEAEHMCMSIRGVHQARRADGDDAFLRRVPRRSQPAGPLHDHAAREVRRASSFRGDAAGAPRMTLSEQFACPSHVARHRRRPRASSQIRCRRARHRGGDRRRQSATC